MNDLVSCSLDEKISALIVQNMESNEKLPTESQLASRWGVSRTALREALRVYESNGMIISRRGSGRYAKMPDLGAQLGHSWRILLNAKRNLLFELLEIRSMLEINSLPKVIERVDMDKLQAMNIQVQKMEERARLGKSFAKQDREFHRLIFACTGNELMEQLLSVFWDLYTASGVEADHEELLKVAGNHKSILEMITKGDLEQLNLLMREQFADARFRIMEFQA